MTMLRREQAKQPDSDESAIFAPSAEFEPYQALFEFLHLTRWPDDGASRTPGTILLFAEGVHLKAMLNDKDQDRVAFFVLNGVDPVLQQLDEAILSRSTDWRASRKSPPRR